MMITKAMLIAIIIVSGGLGALATSIAIPRPPQIECVPVLQNGTTFQPNVKSRRGPSVEF
jgi:hypothetical protein